MRVLTVGNLYPPHHFGGYELVWESAVGFLRSSGHDVRVLAVDYRHQGQADGEDREVFRTLRWYWKDHDFARLGLRERLEIERYNQRQFEVHLERFAPDVLSFWSMGGMSHSLIEQGRRHDLPMVAFVHDEWLDYGRWKDQWMRLFLLRRYGWAAPLAERFTGLPTSVDYANAGRYVFVSEFIRQRALALGLGLHDTDVAHSGIAPVFASPRANTRDWQWRLLYVGRPHPDKGVEDAVRSLERMPENATLTFAGNWYPRDEAALAQSIDRLGLAERVRVLPRLPREEIAELYRSSDVLLFPVRWEEPWGLVPLEAMASGCPVIGTARGGSAEYMQDGENCLVVPVADPSSLAGAVARLASDGELRERLRRGGSLTASRHGEEAFNRAVEAHLLEAVQRGPARASVTAGPRRADGADATAGTLRS